MQWNTSLTWVASSLMMPQSARILTTACSKPAVPLVYRAVVVPTLLYGAEAWVLYQKQIRLLERFHQCCLRSNLGIKWQDHVLNKEVLKRAILPSIESILLQVQLCWAGHITWMEDLCMPKAVFFSKLQEGKHNHGAPRKHDKDQLKRQLAPAGISHQSWQQEASDQDSWRSSVRKVSCKFEAERLKPQKKNAGGRKSEHPIHPHPKRSSVQSVVGDAHQESVSTAANDDARLDHQSSQQSSSARNEPSSVALSSGS